MFGKLYCWTDFSGRIERQTDVIAIKSGVQHRRESNAYERTNDAGLHQSCTYERWNNYGGMYNCKGSRMRQQFLFGRLS